MTKKIDIRTLMSELNLEQLQEVQTSLNKETENKREELRQMVGRRYRDVLETSNTIKFLTQISNDLNVVLTKDRPTFATPADVEPVKIDERSKNLILFNSILNMIFCNNSSHVDISFGIVIAESFLRNFRVEEAQSSVMNRFLQDANDELFLFRDEFYRDTLKEIGVDADPETTISKLISIGILRNVSMSQLLDVYLKSRKEYIIGRLVNEGLTVIDVISSMKNALITLDEIFGSESAFSSILQALSESKWCGEGHALITDDQLSQYGSELDSIFTTITSNYLNSFDCAKQIEYPIFRNVCAEWLANICTEALDHVHVMFDYLNNIHQVADFACALSEIFKGWPVVLVPYKIVYDLLLSEKFIDSFARIITSYFNCLKEELVMSVMNINCNPVPLFHSSNKKFNLMAISGFSKELNNLIEKISEKLIELADQVNKCTIICSEKDMAKLWQILANDTLVFIKKIGDSFGSFINIEQPIGVRNVTKNDRHSTIKFIRLMMAIIQHEPHLFACCIHRVGDVMADCNKLLRDMTELAFCDYMDFLISNHVSQLRNISEMYSRWKNWLDVEQEFELVNLDGSGGPKVEIPQQISGHYSIFLRDIYNEINRQSLGHLFTGNIRMHVCKKIGEILSASLIECATDCAPNTRICAQILFDSKALFLLFLNKDFLEAVRIIETKMEPVHLKLLSDPLSKSARIFAQKSTNLFIHISADSAPSSIKENHMTIAQSDIMPKLSDVRRVALIPRLSQLKDNGAVGIKISDKEIQKNQKHVSNPKNTSRESFVTPQSFTSLYTSLFTSKSSNR